jgi:hypothetical protein
MEGYHNEIQNGAGQKPNFHCLKIWLRPRDSAETYGATRIRTADPLNAIEVTLMAKEYN